MKCPFCIKICTKCKRILVANTINFRKAKKGKYGLYGNCKECDKKWREEHKEEIAKEKRYYYENNKEHILDYQKEYYENNKKEIKEKSKEYRENNPEKVFNQHSKRRQLEENQGNGITKEQWIEMMEFFNWKCAYSGLPLNKDNRSIDHIIPLNKNGEHEIWNVLPMEKHLNISKFTNDMEDWYIQQDFFDIDRLLKIYEWIKYAYNKWGVNDD